MAGRGRMAGRVPYMKENRVFDDEPAVPASSSYEEIFSSPYKEYLGDFLTVSRTLDERFESSSDASSQNHVQEQHRMLREKIKRCARVLQNCRKKKEIMFNQVKQDILDKKDKMLKMVKKSFECMHNEDPKEIEGKCEEMGRVFERIHKLLEEEKQNILEEKGFSEREKLDSQRFLEKALTEKSRIRSEFEAIIMKLNEKRNNDEQLYQDFEEDIQQKVEKAITTMEQNLQSDIDSRVKEARAIISELGKALKNYHHVSQLENL